MADNDAYLTWDCVSYIKHTGKRGKLQKEKVIEEAVISPPISPIGKNV